MTTTQTIAGAAYKLVAAAERLPEIGDDYVSRMRECRAAAEAAERELAAAHAGAEKIWREIEASGEWTADELNAALYVRASRKRRETMTDATTYTAADLVVCESADGWSLHAPGSTDEDIASGDAPYLVSGDHPITPADYDRALRVLAARAAD